MPAWTALATDLGQDGQSMRGWFQAGKLSVKFLQVGNLKGVFEPGQHVATFAERSTKQCTFAIDEVEPQTLFRLNLFRRDDYPHGARCTHCDGPGGNIGTVGAKIGGGSVTKRRKPGY